MFIIPYQEYHIRKFYDVNAMLSEIGGVAKTLIFVFGIIIYPISEYGYHRNVSKKLYLAASKHRDYFRQSSEIKENKKNPMVKWTQEDRIPENYNR